MPIRQIIIQTVCDFNSIEIKYSFTSFSMPLHMFSRHKSPSGAKGGIYLENEVNTMAIDILDPCVPNTPKLMALSMQDKQGIVFHDEGFQLSCQSRSNNANANTFYISYKKSGGLEFTTLLYMGPLMWCYSRFQMSLILSIRLWWNLEIQSYSLMWTNLDWAVLTHRVVGRFILKSPTMILSPGNEWVKLRRWR